MALDSVDDTVAGALVSTVALAGPRAVQVLATAVPVVFHGTKYLKRKLDEASADVAAEYAV